MRQYSPWSLVLIFSGVLNANAQMSDGIKADEPSFSNIPLISSSMVVDKNRKPPAPRPKYPAEARSKGISGEVVMAIKVDEDGKALDTKVLKSEPSDVFDQAVYEAIDSWRFKRVTFDGVPVVYQTKLHFRFTLSNEYPF